MSVFDNRFQMYGQAGSNFGDLVNNIVKAHQQMLLKQQDEQAQQDVQNTFFPQPTQGGAIGMVNPPEPPNRERMAQMFVNPRTAPYAQRAMMGIQATTPQEFQRDPMKDTYTKDPITQQETLVRPALPKAPTANDISWEMEKNPDGSVKQYTFGSSIQSRSIKKLNGKVVEEKYDPLGTIPQNNQANQQIDLNFSPAEKALMEKASKYEIDLSKVASLRGNQRQRLYEGMALFHPEYDATQFVVKSAVRKDFTSGTASKNIRSLNTAIGHLNSLAEASDGLKNGNIQLLNKIANTYRTQTGKSAPTVFNAVKTAVAGELATTFKGTGGTDQEIKQMVETINSSQSPEQVKDVVKTYVDLVESRLGAMEEQYKTALGKPADFQILNDKSKAIVQKIKGIPQGVKRTKKLEDMTDEELDQYEKSLNGK